MNYSATVYVDDIYGRDPGGKGLEQPFRTIISALNVLESITQNSSQRALIVILPGRYNERFLNFINVDVKAIGSVLINLNAIGKVSGSNLMEDSGVEFY